MTRLFAGTPLDRPPVCERCGKLESDCTCPPVPPQKKFVPPEKQTARLSVERRSKGKTVTVVKGLASADNDLPALLKQLKNHCGAGGTLTGDELEIQGEHLERLRKLLGEIGYRVK
jgi:translation initiation factor 1